MLSHGAWDSRRLQPNRITEPSKAHVGHRVECLQMYRASVHKRKIGGLITTFPKQGQHPITSRCLGVSPQRCQPSYRSLCVDMFLCAHLSLDKWLRGSLFSVSILPPLQAKNERNYHIFYELLAGLPAQLRQAFSLQEAETYYYLNQVSLHRVTQLCGSKAPKAHSSWQLQQEHQSSVGRGPYLIFPLFITNMMGLHVPSLGLSLLF